MIIQDSLTLDASGLKLTRDGFLIGEAKVSRAGNVQQYLGSELGLTGDQANQLFGVYRDPDVVFDSASMMSLAGRPVTRGHPKNGVTADNWAELAKGQMGGVIRRDGEHVVAPMAIMDAAAAKEVYDGARCLSAGYTVDVIPGEGTAEDGTPYQFRQAGQLRFNHVAYLPDNNPRAGNTRVGDENRSDARGKPDAVNQPLNYGDRQMTLKTIIVDGLPVETTDAGEAAINLLRGKLSDAAQAMTTAKDTNDAAIAAKDAELATKDAEIATLKKAVEDAKVTPLQMRDAARVFAKTLADAKLLAPKVEISDAMDAPAVMKAVVASRIGATAKDWTDAQIEVSFNTLSAGLTDEQRKASPDPLRDIIADGEAPETAQKAVNDARAEMLADLTGQKTAA